MAKPTLGNFKELASVLREVLSVEDAVEHVVTYAVQTLGTSFGAVTLISKGGKRFETLAATHPNVAAADVLQYELNEGPCVDAATRSTTLSSSDLATDERWPQWGPRAAELGFRSIIAAELHARGRRIGAISLYGDVPATFSHDDLELAQLFAYQASLALALVRTEHTMHQAIDSRTVIGQAQGIVMQRYQVDAEQAFAVIRRHAQNRNLKLQDLAVQIVTQCDLPVPNKPVPN